MQASFLAEKCLGYQQIIGLAAATVPTVPDGCSLIVVAPETQGVRYRDDGTDPTAAIGFPLNPGQVLFFTGAQIPRLKFIQQAATSTLNLLYYG
jgi:hypothetical protein